MHLLIEIGGFHRELVPLEGGGEGRVRRQMAIERVTGVNRSLRIGWYFKIGY